MITFASALQTLKHMSGKNHKIVEKVEKTQLLPQCPRPLIFENAPTIMGFILHIVRNTQMHNRKTSKWHAFFVIEEPHLKDI
jgi:hypothetical protein